jgi:hypothetical protein
MGRGYETTAGLHVLTGKLARDGIGGIENIENIENLRQRS